MNNAQEVKAQIETLYRLGANYADVARHLYNDMLDSGVPSAHKSAGRDSAFDGSLTVVHYADGSMLVIPSCGGLSASA
jgi:hypothetical protein